ncbi:MAG: ROK family protein [Lentisphaerae bacterium]|nr:ROK family protein [Lentisphaerota bacterium]
MTTSQPNNTRTAPLDRGFLSTARFNELYRSALRQAGNGVPFVLATEQPDGTVSHYETVIRSDASPETLHYAARLTKFLLWARGASRVHVIAPDGVVAHLRKVFAADGARGFDYAIMTRVFGQPLEIVRATRASLPSNRGQASACGGHWDGCRLGFDLGASDFKVAAVRDGQVVYSAEFPWQPKEQADPDYHFDHLMAGLRQAASHLPRVDAIGGSTAGVVFDNHIRLASLFRSIPESRFAEASRLFIRVRDAWKVPLMVLNDGDVSALAGALSSDAKGILGLAFGSSLAGGYVDPEGRMRGWITELAFVPVDENPAAPADEWSGDRGVGCLYFSQQAVNKLLPAAGIVCPAEMGQPERLLHVQDLLARGDPRAAPIYETLGVYLGETLPLFAEFYDFRHVLVLGRVLTGAGGDILIQRAREVLNAAAPECAARMDVSAPDEQSRRVGQAVAAASLPERVPA